MRNDERDCVNHTPTEGTRMSRKELEALRTATRERISRLREKSHEVRKILEARKQKSLRRSA
jgi:hypothetical protein